MVTNGTPPGKPPTVLSLSRGGKVVMSISLSALIATIVAMVGPCCSQFQPPEAPPPIGPAPTATEDSGNEPAPEASADAHPIKPCQFVTPKDRGSGKRKTRIVQGTPAPQTGERSFPFAAALTTPLRQQYCTGSVYKDRWVLTAAHCLVDPGDYVLVGSTYLGDARAVRTIETRIHPLYDVTPHDWDVSVVRLSSDAGVPTVRLATGKQTNDATVAGWGRTSEGGQTTQHLLFVNVPMTWTDVQCQGRYPEFTPRMVCAGGQGTGDSCQGDSGGPLLAWNGITLPPRWEQIGITSFGRGCDREGWPGVYTYIPGPILEWIESCTQ